MEAVTAEALQDQDRFPYESGESVVQYAASLGIKPPSAIPAWQWMEENIQLSRGMSRLPGPYRTDLTPMVRTVADDYQKPTTRRLTLLVSAQSAKTQAILNLFHWVVNEDPDPTMWVMANADMMDEFLKKKLWPSIETCKLTGEKIPQERRAVSKGVILFDTMFLVMRGSNSRSKLQSDPIRNLFFDERREWKPGAIDLVRKRVRSYENYRELSAGTAGTKGDELHTDYMEGSQTLFHWHCPKCNHSQPFRFGRNKTAVFERERVKGGVVFDRDKADDEEAFKASVRYECEECEHRFSSDKKVELLKGLHPVDYNPGSGLEKRSFHWNALYMPWPSCSFEEVAWEFIQAHKQQKLGNEQPMRAFVTETLGEPWVNLAEEQLIRPDVSDGVIEVTDEYFRVMTIDMQARDWWYVVRAWWRNAESKMVAYGHVDNTDDLDRIRRECKVLPMFTALDSGYDAPAAYQICHKYGGHFKGKFYPWIATKGMRQDYYTETHNGRRVRRLFQISEARTGYRVPLWLIATTGCKDIVCNLRDGKGAKWLALPSVSHDYIEQINSEVKTREYKDGREIAFYDKVSDRRRNEFFDCESNQIPICNWMGVFDVR